MVSITKLLGNNVRSFLFSRYPLHTIHSSFFFLPFLPVGHPAGLDGFVGCIDLTYLRDSLTNIRIRVFIRQAVPL